MSDSRSWVSDEEIESRIKYEKLEIEKAKNNPQYYRWRELREKFKEYDEYKFLKETWDRYTTLKPEEVKITVEMVSQLRDMTNLPMKLCATALKIYNGDIDKAKEYLYKK